MSRRRPLIVVFGVLAFAGLVIGATVSPSSGRWLKGFSGIPGIEDRLEDDARAILDDVGLADAWADADGRNLTIDSASPVPLAVENSLSSIAGVGSVSIEAPAEAAGSGSGADDGADDAAGSTDTGGDGSGDDPATDSGADDVAADVRVSFDGSSMALVGTVQTLEGRDALIRSAERVVGADNVVDELQVTDGSGSDFSQVSALASTVRRVGGWYQTAELELADDELVVRGVALPQAEPGLAEQTITEFAESADLDVAVVDVASSPDPDPADSATDEGESDSAADEGGSDSGSESEVGGDAGELAGAVAEVLAGLDTAAIEFEPGTATLTGEALTVLDDVAAQIRELPAVPITVVGHTSDEGDPDVNLLLSDDRARAVRDHLVAQGVSTDLLAAVGVGASQPIADNDTAKGRASNERIELVVTEGNN